MCAIFGFAGFEETGLLQRMARILAHRGPDGEGFFSAPGFSMGMRRLSIIDLEAGWQPIYNEDASLAVCYNGEIYNYVELAEELRGRGHVFRTHSDTEVIVHAYEEWGEECLQRFNGMFAFALYDRRRQELFLARDRCGQKPLYYWHESGKLIFASEVKAILESQRVARECNTRALDAYLGLRYVPEPATMFKDIRTLPAAHCMRWKAGETPAARRYWDIQLHQGGGYQSDDWYLEQIEAKLFDAVRLTMRSDVPVAAYLSGGVDSSVIVAAMTRFNPDINTFSIGFDSPIDETRDAAETARFLGTRHTEVHCLPQDFDLLRKVIWHMDRPVGDALIIAFYKLAEAASKQFKVVLSGEGADEVYAGYSFHKVMQLVHGYMRCMPGFLHQAGVVPLLNAVPVGLLNRMFEFPAYLGERGKARLVSFLRHYRGRNLFQNYAALKTLWDIDERRSIYSREFAQRANDDWIPQVRDEGGHFLDRLLKLQYDEWLQDWAIIRQDKNTMAHSLEIRLPFLDHTLIEEGFRMPPHIKARFLKDKIIERRLAAKLLPREVVNRPKNPFFLPMEFFFEHPQISALIRETLNRDQVKRRGYFDPDKVEQLLQKMQTREFVYLKQVMSLVILELWHQVFIDKQSP